MPKWLRWLGNLSSETGGFEMHQGWFASSLREQRTLIYEDSRKGLQTVLEFGRRQEDKAFALGTVALIATGAIGIFGDLRLGNDALGLASICAVILSVVSAALVITVVRPRKWNLGSDPRNILEREPADEEVLHLSDLYTVVQAYHWNHELLVKRGRLLMPLVLALTLQLGAILSVALIASFESSDVPLDCCVLNTETTQQDY